MMSRLQHASIKIKMTILSLIGLMGFSAILVGNFSFFDQTSKQLSRAQTVDLQMVQLASELQLGFGDLNRLFEAAVVEADKDTLAEGLKLAEDMQTLMVRMGALGQGSAGDTRDLLASFKDYVGENEDYARNVIEGRLEGDAMYGAFSAALDKRETYDQKLRAFIRGINGGLAATLQSLRDRSAEVTKNQFLFSALLVLLLMFALIWLIRIVTSAIENVIGVAGQIAEGNLDVKVSQVSSDEFQRLFRALDVMRLRLKQQHTENDTRQKRQMQIARLNEVLRGERTVQVLGDNILRCLAEQLDCQAGAFYLLENAELVLKATYAYTVRKGNRNRVGLGEGLVGQAGLEQHLFVVRDLPTDYAPISSGLGEAVPRELMLVPLVLNGELLAVLELLSFRPFHPDDIEFINRGMDGMSISLGSALSRLRLADALEQTRSQAEALTQQQEELRATNEELEEQASILRASEENLQQQQEELRVMNEELEERNRLLDRQKEEIVVNNAALERSREELQLKARQLELSGRYKSEFLSTMSHELRTPLNSILILSQGLMENRPGNLADKQVEHARVIHSSGRDLLMLINDILDLSKVEEGKLELVAEDVNLQEFSAKLLGQFEAQAEAKGIGFSVSMSESVPEAIQSDEHRLSQILRNFISNALKFTHRGKVEIAIGIPAAALEVAAGVLLPQDAIVFHVRDSGIGVPADKQQLIFEAFQQVDGTISRKYGGTGLGLTISRKLAELMGGCIQLVSAGENQGSTFSLVLPRRLPVAVLQPQQATAKIEKPPAVIKPAITQRQAPAPVALENAILIVEDDPGFSQVLHELAGEFGFNATCVHSVEDAMQYLARHLPGSIILDLGLPDAPGEQLLDQLKSNPQTARIPVHVISGNPNVDPNALKGANEFIAKPFGRDRLDQLFADIQTELGLFTHQQVLIIEDDPVQREQLEANFARKNIRCDVALTGAEAKTLLQTHQYGAIILDLDLPDCDGMKLLEELGRNKDANTRIIIYTAQDLSKKQDAQLRRFADRVVLKTDQSIGRLLNETTLFLHWVKGNDKEVLSRPSADTAPAKGKRILLVDDDIRNLYSLSAVLEDFGLDIITASTGVEALDALNTAESIDLVLMDIMMPEMDGLEAMEHIRADARFSKIPIIALTAKAMRDDRARCMEAGANDYLSKPVDTGKLKAIVKMWLDQS